MIRTAFILPDRARWTGGYQYFVNLFRALHRYGRQRVRPVVFVSDAYPTDVLEPLQGDIADVVQIAIKEFRSPTLATLLTGVDRRALSQYRRNQVQVVFESATWHGWRFPLPLIAWLPDFQHRRLPGMFGWASWLHRELGFRAQVACASAVMLSSETARSDCETLYPKSRGTTEVVPFAVEPGDEAFRVSETEVQTRYGLAPPYFYLPNQYWRHKNHIVIIEALQMLRARNVSATVVASGSSVDPRHPGLFDELVERARGLGLCEAFRFLRFVPRADLYALMRGSVAVVNPSLFEGWSTTVEEAKAIGAPLVLSDIAVHREQTGGDARYFDPRSPDRAAAALAEALAQDRRCRNGEARTKARTRNSERLQSYAFQFEDLIERLAG